MSQPGQSRPPEEPWPPAERSIPRNGFGIASLGLALLGFGIGWMPATLHAEVVLGGLAALCGVIGCIRIGQRAAGNTAVTVAGLALGAGVVVLSLLALRH